MSDAAPGVVVGDALCSWLDFASLELRPRLTRRILDDLGGPGAALESSMAELLSIEGVTPEIAGRIQACTRRQDREKGIEYARKQNLFGIPYDGGSFPLLLREVADSPAVLFGRGNAGALHGDCVAMVGTRLATRYGRMIAESMAAALAAKGVAVISGGAIGIDTAAHKGACSTGVTVAVLGCGLDIQYPASNQALFNQISENGAVISEFSLGARPDSWRFPARNRIISGLSQATIVVEAAERSGAIITAGMAGDQGREVMAVPGPVNSPQSRGCHALIRDGATLVENADQVLESLGWQSGAAAEPPKDRPAPDLPLEEGFLLLALRSGQKHLDELAVECGLTSAQTGAGLTMLEIRGMVKRIPGNQFVRTM